MRDFSTLVQECSKDHILPFSYHKHNPYNFTLRELDSIEACAATGMEDPCAALHMSILMSNYVWVVVGDGEKDVRAYFGLVEGNDQAMPWFLGGYNMSSFNPIKVARASKRVVKLFKEKYPYGLTNYVMGDYRVSIEWLIFLGADIQVDAPVRFFNEPINFYKFTL